MSSVTHIANSPARSPWFRSAPFDLLLILCVPLLTWPLLTAARLSWGADLLTKLLLLTATGHYMATFVRAYGDLELFQRFKTRFLFAPITLLVTCLYLMANGYDAQLFILVAIWGFWHWLAQAFGFARIYDIKVGSYRPLTAWLDKALVVTGFIGTVVLNDGALATWGSLFLNADIPLPSSDVRDTMQAVVLVAVVLVGSAYLLNLLATIARGLPWSWQKQLMHVTTIGYYWFAFAWAPNVLIAYVLYELFHDIQYYAITWITCQQRVRRPGVSGWMRRMFQPGWMTATVFLLAMTLFGYIDYCGRHEWLAEGEYSYSIWVGVFATAALLHYYYDGFIWKARESTLGNDLGIKDGMRAAVIPGIRHGMYWSLFFVPLILLVAYGRNEISPKERLESLAAFAPHDFLSQKRLGDSIGLAGDLPGACDHYQKAIALNPDFGATHLAYGAALEEQGDLDEAIVQYQKTLACEDHGSTHITAHLNYGGALEVHGDLDEAISQYEQALACEDHNGTHLKVHLHLGCLLQAMGKAAEAVDHLKKAEQPESAYAIGRLLGMALRMPDDAKERREQYCMAATQLDGSNADAQYELGRVLVDRFKFREAMPHLQFVVRQRQRDIRALLPLARAQIELGLIVEARKSISTLLQVDPNNKQAHELKARVGGL